MASKFLRRSGIALGLVAELIDWKADFVVQVGVGYHYDEQEVPVLQEAFPGVKLHGFEPNPVIADKIKATYPGTLEELAISDKVGEATLYYKRRHKDGGSLFRAKEEYGANDQITASVKTATLDHLFPSGPNHDHTLLWIDCEGSELNVLKGAENFLAGVEVINVETTAKPIGHGWSDQVEIHEFLIQRGYFHQHTHTQRVNFGQNDKIYVRPHLFRPEICCCAYEITRFAKREFYGGKVSWRGLLEFEQDQ